ncbi:MAG: HigA family addiction module antitoxin [Gammaproteobacteria bacterium]|nr:HigA family addiction module antitoxin [Gammaproteobacteria bacterium]
MHTTRKSSTTPDGDPTRLDPIHPGEVLKQDFMVPLGLSDSALARAIGVTPARINEIARGRRGITAETALRLARYFRTDPNSWMNLQDHYELALAERTVADAHQSIQPREVA